MRTDQVSTKGKESVLKPPEGARLGDRVFGRRRDPLCVCVWWGVAVFFLFLFFCFFSSVNLREFMI